MGCNCNRSTKVETTRSEQLLSGTIPTVSLEVLKERRDTCRKCSFCTLNPDPKFTKFGGLTHLSKCTKSGRLIIECLKDPDYACPVNSFLVQNAANGWRFARRVLVAANAVRRSRSLIRRFCSLRWRILCRRFSFLCIIISRFPTRCFCPRSGFWCKTLGANLCPLSFDFRPSRH